MSRGLRIRAFAVPPAFSRARTSPAFSSNGRTGPTTRVCGPSGPENHRSNSLRFVPAGFSRIARRMSATVRQAIKQMLEDVLMEQGGSPVHVAVRCNRAFETEFG